MFDLQQTLRERASAAYLAFQMDEAERLENEEGDIKDAAWEELQWRLGLTTDEVAEIPWERATFVYNNITHIRMEFVMEDMRFSLRRWPLDNEDMELKVYLNGANGLEIKDLADLGKKLALHGKPVGPVKHDGRTK